MAAVALGPALDPDGWSHSLLIEVRRFAQPYTSAVHLWRELLLPNPRALRTEPYREGGTWEVRALDGHGRPLSACSVAPPYELVGNVDSSIPPRLRHHGEPGIWGAGDHAYWAAWVVLASTQAYRPELDALSTLLLQCGVAGVT